MYFLLNSDLPTILASEETAIIIMAKYHPLYYTHIIDIKEAHCLGSFFLVDESQFTAPPVGPQQHPY
jgi:hypothetical protein